MGTLLPAISCAGHKATKTVAVSHLYTDMRSSGTLHPVGKDGVGVVDDGDLAAFTAFATAARGRMWWAAYRLCSDWQLADDLVQESILSVYRRWPRLDHSGDMYPYVHRTMVNMALREHQRAWRRHEQCQPPLESASNEDESIETRQVLAHALTLLGPQQRTILILRYYEDLSVAATAREVQCTPSTVRSQTTRAIRTLRNILGPTFTPRR
jgi:RNA polymerase sigma factor (sigma-70 family)